VQAERVYPTRQAACVDFDRPLLHQPGLRVPLSHVRRSVSWVRVSVFQEGPVRAVECRHPTGRERTGSHTLQPLQDPILLLPWLCFRGGDFPNPSTGWWFSVLQQPPHHSRNRTRWPDSHKPVREIAATPRACSRCAASPGWRCGRSALSGRRCRGWRRPAPPAPTACCWHCTRSSLPPTGVGATSALHLNPSPSLGMAAARRIAGGVKAGASRVSGLLSLSLSLS
jgi:hypothetical protein